MKNALTILCMLMLLHLSCSDNTPNESTKGTAETTHTSNKAKQGDGVDPAIVGDWILYYIGNDDNNNKQFDEAEIANATQHWGRPNDKRKVVWHFNANGTYSSREENLKSGQITDTGGSMWSVKNEAGGKVLYMQKQDKSNEPSKGFIMKLDGNELQWVHIDDLATGFIYAFRRN